MTILDYVEKVTRKINVPTILCIGAMLWYFSAKSDEKFDQSMKRIDKLYEMFIDLLKEKK